MRLNRRLNSSDIESRLLRRAASAKTELKMDDDCRSIFTTSPMPVNKAPKSRPLSMKSFPSELGKLVEDDASVPASIDERVPAPRAPAAPSPAPSVLKNVNRRGIAFEAVEEDIREEDPDGQLDEDGSRNSVCPTLDSYGTQDEWSIGENSAERRERMSGIEAMILMGKLGVIAAARLTECTMKGADVVLVQLEGACDGRDDSFVDEETPRTKESSRRGKKSRGRRSKNDYYDDDEESYDSYHG